jgi:predicted small secreted protein
MARAGPSDYRDRPSPASPEAILGSGTIMKKVAVTVAVLALGLAACQPKAEDNAVGNEANVEDTANADVNAATNDAVDAGNAADNLLDQAGNEISNAGNAVDNAANTVSNATENAAH